LVTDFVGLVADLDARTFVFENVKGLTVGAHRAFLAELVEAFDSAGYNVRLPWRVLDVANFGVPQHRERLILLGAKKGLRVPDYPVPSTHPADRPMLATPLLASALPIGPTCEDAIGDIPDAESFAQLSDGDVVRARSFGRPSKYARELRGGADCVWHEGYRRTWDSQLLTSSARTVHTQISRTRFSETEPGTVEPISRFFKLSSFGLANTLRAGTDGARGAFTSPRPIHYAHPRCITVREMARLHGFPDWFRFHATKWHGARQVGNSVPPPLARAVARAVLQALDLTPARPNEVLSLGDPSLLYLEMSEAAEHFGVIAPSSRRDRKSGTRKRKQYETEAARLKLVKRPA
jgi:DNA (cytosine-5)-methyltransferase 1